MKEILHIATAHDVAIARQRGEYRCASLQSEGFIHCCTAEQLSGVISRYYDGVDDIALLKIDVAALDAELCYENTVGGVDLFPHVYGAIPLDAVRETTPFGLDSSARASL